MADELRQQAIRLSVFVLLWGPLRTLVLRGLELGSCTLWAESTLSPLFVAARESRAPFRAQA